MTDSDSDSERSQSEGLASHDDDAHLFAKGKRDERASDTRERDEKWRENADRDWREDAERMRKGGKWKDEEQMPAKNWREKAREKWREYDGMDDSEEEAIARKSRKRRNFVDVEDEAAELRGRAEYMSEEDDENSREKDLGRKRVRSASLDMEVMQGREKKRALEAERQRNKETAAKSQAKGGKNEAPARSDGKAKFADKTREEAGDARGGVRYGRQDSDGDEFSDQDSEPSAVKERGSAPDNTKKQRQGDGDVRERYAEAREKSGSASDKKDKSVPAAKKDSSASKRRGEAAAQQQEEDEEPLPPVPAWKDFIAAYNVSFP